MNRSLNVLATRACLAAVAVACQRCSAAPSSRATPGRPSSSPGPRLSRPARTASSSAARRSPSRSTTKDGEDASYTFTSADPTIATVDGDGRRHRRRGRRDRDHRHGRRLAGDRRATRWSSSRRPTRRRSPTTTPGRCRPTPTRPALAFNNWNQDGQVPTTCARCHSSEGFVDYLGRRRQRAGRGRQARADQVGDPLRHLPQPRRRRAVVGDVPLGRHRRRAGRRGALHDLPPGALVRARTSTPRSPRPPPATDDTVSADAQLPEHPLLPGRRHAVRRARQGRLPVRRPGLRRPLPPRRRLRHLHRLPRPALDAGQVRRLRRLPRRRHRRRRRAPDPDDVVGRHRLRRRRQHQRGDLRRARRPARQAGRGDPDATARSTARRSATPPAAYPYWFVDGDGDGTLLRPPRRSSANAFASWTARLLRATYNYQLASKDPGAFAHNAKYIIELLYDSVTDVNTRAGRQGRHEPRRRAPTSATSTAPARRPATGTRTSRSTPAARAATAARTASASTSSTALGQVVPETANGLECGTCHDKPGTDFSAIIAVPVGDVSLGRHPAGAGLRQPLRDLPPRPRGQGHRRRGDRGGQAGVQERALPARRRGQARRRRSTSATNTTARPTPAR